MPEFLYRDEDHTYHLDDGKLPSVTEIISACGLINSKNFTEESRIKGKYVHKALLYLLQDDLNNNSLSDEIRPYIGHFCAFREVYPFTPYLPLCEKPQYHPISLYAGTPDIPGYLSQGTFHQETQDILIDTKTGIEQDWHGIQLYAYADMLEAQGVLKHPLMYGLYLSDIAWKLVEYKARDYRQIWNSCLTIYNFRRNNGYPINNT